MSPAIHVENLSKKYRINAPQSASPSWWRRLGDVAATPIRGIRQGAALGLVEDFWALRDVSFSVQPGDVMAIIGQNGAGKSTLLKILTRVTLPTAGRAVVRGNVGSMLEVGTGFNPELSGRDNIYLNGSMLGMRRSEIKRKFDEIVAFSEMEQFLDTPVKRYSSGMKVRLGFAVASHLDLQVMLIDEVLAVGDATFRRKSLDKMHQLALEGRTVLFVSHNMPAIQSMCQNALWLEQGRVRMSGPVSDVVIEYLGSTVTDDNERFWPDVKSAPGNEQVRLRRIAIEPADDSRFDQIHRDTPLDITVEYWQTSGADMLDVTLQLIYAPNTIAFATSAGRRLPEGTREEGLHRAQCRIPANLLNDGPYSVKVMIAQDRTHVIYEHSEQMSFHVHDLAVRRGAYFGKRPGVVQPQLDWNVEYLPDKR